MEKFLFRNLAKTITDILLPPACLGCKVEAPQNSAAGQGFFICAQCREKINEHKYFVCPICKRRSVDGRLDPKCRVESGLTRYVGAPLPYSNELVKKMIHSLKYQRAKAIALPLSQLLIEFLNKNKFGDLVKSYLKKTLLAPVPLYNFRERERGFNQANEIARETAKYYDIPLLEKALLKTKNTEPQADIKNKDERLENIAGAFVINKRGSDPLRGSDPDRFIKNKIIILVDDVYTSGATMRECAIVLRKVGAAEVWGMTVARG